MNLEPLEVDQLWETCKLEWIEKGFFFTG